MKLHQLFIHLIMSVILMTSTAFAADSLANQYYQQAIQAHQSGKSVQSINFLSKAAARNHVQAQAALGMIYAEGKLAKRNLSAAATWLRKAGTNGDVVSQYNLGIMYAQGLGVPKGLPEAYRWFQKAAQKQHAGAMYNLGVMLIKGIGVPKNEQAGLVWIKKSAKLGHKDAISAT